MATHPNNNLAGTNEDSYESTEIRQGFVDAHCHCLPALDDGPPTNIEAFALARALVADGITTVIATPHQLGRFSDCNEASQIRQAVSDFNEQLNHNDIPLNIMPGGDVRVDERICQLIEQDKILTLADNRRYLLIELPHEIFIDIDSLLTDLASMGIQAIVSHPERHPILVRKPHVLSKWLDHSAHLQITAGSLLGNFGSNAKDAAWNYLNSGVVSIVATDAHNLRSRKPCMTETFLAISTQLGQNVAELLCIKNPARISNGQDIEVVSPHKQKVTW
ncbi:MAG: hypothetical protein KAS75_01545 [Planctomycetes bacterium]|nr:hypothetical protein [Planctomycetota bacterium]